MDYSPTATEVMALRARMRPTYARVLECKRALQETNGDQDQAVRVIARLIGRELQGLSYSIPALAELDRVQKAEEPSEESS